MVIQNGENFITLYCKNIPALGVLFFTYCKKVMEEEHTFFSHLWRSQMVVLVCRAHLV